MVLLTGNVINGIMEVKCTHFIWDDLASEVVEKGVLVENDIEPIHLKDKLAIKYCDITTKEITYRYVDVPITPKTELENLQIEMEVMKQNQLDIQIAMANMMGV